MMLKRWNAIECIPKGERSRTAIRILLGIDDEPEPSPPEDQDEKCSHGVFAEKSKVKLEEVNVDGELSRRRQLRKINQSNLSSLIYLDRLGQFPLIEEESEKNEEEENENENENEKQLREIQQPKEKEIETQVALWAEAPERQYKAPLWIHRAEQDDDNDKIDDSDGADAHLDESNVTPFSLTRYERKQGHQPNIGYSESNQYVASQPNHTYNDQASRKEAVIDLCEQEPSKHLKTQVKLEKDVVEISSLQFQSSCARTSILHIDTTRPGGKPAPFPKSPSLPAFKKKMQKNIKQLKKEFAKSINIADRRMIRSQSSSFYEYLWELAGLSCWKSLQDRQSLLDLYLCQVRSQNSPVLKYLSSELSNDLPYLIYKIENSPFTHNSLHSQDIERAIHGNLFTMEVARYFQQALLNKALCFNRMCENEREQQEKYAHRQSVVRPKTRTIFIDLEEQKERPVKVKLPAEPKLESSMGMSRTHFSLPLKACRK